MSEIPEGYNVAEWTLAEGLAKADGFVSLWAPAKDSRNWFIRMARAILAERERCALEAKTAAQNAIMVGMPIREMPKAIYAAIRNPLPTENSK